MSWLREDVGRTHHTRFGRQKVLSGSGCPGTAIFSLLWQSMANGGIGDLGWRGKYRYESPEVVALMLATTSHKLDRT